MAKLIADQKGNFAWWIKLFKSSHESWNIAQDFTKRLKSNVTFIHPLHNGPIRSGFRYINKNDEIYVSIDLSYESGYLILSEELGKYLKIEPTYTYDYIYLVDNLTIDELLDITDKYIDIVEKKR